MEKFLSPPGQVIDFRPPESESSPSPKKTIEPTPQPQVPLVSPKKELSDPMTTPPLGKKKPIRGSTIWDHFTKIKGGDVENPRCSCNYCGKDYACDTKRVGTSSMRVHLDKQCKKYPFRVIDKKQKVLSFQGNNAGGGNLLALSFNKEECRKALAKMLVLDELSFRFVEGKGFKQFVQNLQPRFVPTSRMTVARDIYQLFLDEKVKLKAELTKVGQRVSLTTDCWTSLQQINYLCLTAHYIDSDWCLQKRILNFCQIPNHKGETIGKILESCLLGWGIERVLTITVDNASANDVAINVVKRRVNGWKGTVLDGEHMHLRCCAHISNLIVTEGLKDMHESIAAIRNVVRYIRSSPARIQKFKVCVEKEKIEYNGLLVLDVPTRWNSTYLMLDVAVKFQNAFERYDEKDEKYLSYFDEEESGKKKIGPPYGNDWENARVFIKFLKTFYDITLKFSASNHVTSNAYYHEMVELQCQLNDLAISGDKLLSKMATSMKRKFDKYWGNVDNINCLLFVAIVLDPRFKMSYLKYSFGAVYDIEMAAKLNLKVEKLLQCLYGFYQGGTTANDDDVVSDKTSPKSTTPESRKLLSQFLMQQQKSYNNEKNNELEKYLAEENVNPLVGSFDILAWWKENSMRYKVLSLIARDVLAIPVSTVASESAFSTSGRILDSFRSSLSPKMVEALVCTQNWLRSTHDVLRLGQVVDEVHIYEKVEIECEGSISSNVVKGKKTDSKKMPMMVD